ncbi:hypothetical protein [Sphingomonas sp. GM_Shp_2]|uniref:hypothetical protein n=1 Tax=Sphingomonas sp. GM_Shp_2 TaxID=2937380 RepID=UPI00226A8F24|nr:hypothetical protein [Sphingomonas sp. GM_Shp_2]
MGAEAFRLANRAVAVTLCLFAAGGTSAWAMENSPATIPTASPQQIAEALDDCIKADGVRAKLEAAGWAADKALPSGNGMTTYRKAGSGAMMPLFDPAAPMRCWVMSKTDQPSARYVEAVTALLGPPSGEPSKSSGPQAGDLEYSLQWNAKGFAIPMDAFKTPEPGLRIEVWRKPADPQT